MMPKADTETDDVVMEAEKALLDPNQLTSEPDLYYAKMQYEERLKYALRYEFAFESPLKFVQRFFESAFSPAERAQPDGPIRKWQEFTECVIKNTTFFPLSREFHPVYIAAAYLTWTRNMQNTTVAMTCSDSDDKKHA